MRNLLRDIAGKGSSTLDGLIAALAAAQHGVVARRQLLALGLTDDAIDFRLACGRLHLLYRGVYAVGHPNVPRAGMRMAATLTYGDDAALSHMGAAAHWPLCPVLAAFT